MTDIATVALLKARAEKLESVLYLAQGAIAALIFELDIPEYRRIRFTGPWAHMGTITLDAVLAQADEALKVRQ